MVFVIMSFATVVFALFWQWQENKAYGIINIHVIKLKNGFFAFLSILPIYLVYSLQYSMHSDYDNYYKWFYQIKSGSYEISDFSVNLIFKVIGKLGLDFHVVLFVIYAISFFIMICCLKRYSKLYASSILIFVSVFFTLGFLQIRQLVAVMLVLYAYRFIEEEKFIPYFILVLIAASFHSSAIIMLPFYFIFKIRLKLSHFIVFSAGMSFLALFTNTLLPLVTKIFFSKYYGRHEMFRGLQLSKLDIAIQLIILVVVLLYGRNFVKLSRINQIFVYAFFIQFILFFICRWIPEMQRLLYYFYIPVIVLVPSLIATDPNAKQKYLMQIIIPVLIFIIFLLRFRNSGILHNYTSIFSS